MKKLLEAAKNLGLNAKPSRWCNNQITIVYNGIEYEMSELSHAPNQFNFCCCSDEYYKDEDFYGQYENRIYIAKTAKEALIKALQDFII